MKRIIIAMVSSVVIGAVLVTAAVLMTAASGMDRTAGPAISNIGWLAAVLVSAAVAWALSRTWWLPLVTAIVLAALTVFGFGLRLF